MKGQSGSSETILLLEFQFENVVCEEKQGSWSPIHTKDFEEMVSALLVVWGHAGLK